MCKRTSTTHKDRIYQTKLNEGVTQKDQVLHSKSGFRHQLNFWHYLYYTATCKSHVNYSLKSYQRVKEVKVKFPPDWQKAALWKRTSFIPPTQFVKRWGRYFTLHRRVRKQQRKLCDTGKHWTWSLVITDPSCISSDCNPLCKSNCTADTLAVKRKKSLYPEYGFDIWTAITCLNN